MIEKADSLEQVALLAEGVDRNNTVTSVAITSGMSPSSRRAWIEIPAVSTRYGEADVALLAEGVDRNNPGFRQASHAIRRPPRGGRG